MNKIASFPSSLAIEEQACQWLVKFESDEKPSIQEIKQFNAWLSKSPVHRQTLLRLAKTWSDMDIMSGLMIPLGCSLKPRKCKFAAITSAVAIFTKNISGAVVSKTLRGVRPLMLLPVLILVVTLSLSFFKTSLRPVIPNNSYVTSIGEHSKHILDDGSVLSLNSNSKVEVNYDLSKRVVNLLKGEAHFDVIFDPHRPFEVYVGNRVVKAVGTAFSVYRLEENVEVLVTEGKVELAVIESTLLVKPDLSSIKNNALNQNLGVNSTENTVTVVASLVAGQSISIPIRSNQLDAPVVKYAQGELVRKLSWLDGRLVFAGESLEEVVAEVSRHTPILIEVVDPELKQLRIGGQFQAGETDALFDVLESGFGVKITRINKSHVQLDAK